MSSNHTQHRKKTAVLFFLLCLCMAGLTGRLVYLMVYRSDYYSKMAEELHQRERSIKAARGRIIDATGTVIATNRTVCTISVIYNQVEDREQVIRILSRELGIEEEKVRKRVEKRSSREIISTNVDKEIGDRIRNFHLAGVKVDEDYRRYYPYDSLASRVLGFTGGDNQGIIGLEVVYEEWLKGAKQVSVIVMNPQNGEIMAMVNVPEFHLNDPFTLTEAYAAEGENRQELLNRMWRNPAINDTYEPGSTFKIITAAAGLEAGAVGLEDHFSCPGFRIVEDRKIRCHKTGGHGGETFLQGVMNSCNPVFIDVGQRLGVDRYYHYFEQFGLKEKTGIDLPGEAGTIMHKKENMGLVELATVSFGQSFQITPIQLITTAASIINGGNRVTPHFAVRAVSSDRTSVHRFSWPVKEHIVSEETSASMRYILEQVVAEGSGKKAAVEGFRIGGKTATSEKLPRSLKKYISSFIGFAPADNPRVIALITIDEPQGVYYGGTIAAPVIADIFKNILPYLGIPEAVEETAGSMGISS